MDGGERGSQSKINVSNVGSRLFERYVYFRDSFRAASTEAEASKNEYNAKQKQRQFVFDIPLYSLIFFQHVADG